MELDHTEKVDGIIKKYEGRKEAIIAILQDIQGELKWLPESALKLVSKRLKIPLNKIYGIATFYKAFSLKPKGKHTITVCMGTACHVRGAPKILDELKRILNIEEGGTTEDRMFTLETVNCLGACALGPIVVADSEYIGHMNKSKIDELMKKLKKGEEE